MAHCGPVGSSYQTTAGSVNTMAKVHHLSTSGCLQLRIQLQGLEPAIWRRVRVPANITLGRLHRVIQTVMGWTDSHLHEYIIGGQRYGQPDPDWDLPHQITPEARVKLATALSGRKSFTYLYDFGDDWEHQIKIEKVLPAEAMIHPVCMAGEHACPPEDVGGAPGYVDFVQAISDPHHPEHQEMLEWCGGSFDPYGFDIARVNQNLKRIKL